MKLARSIILLLLAAFLALLFALNVVEVRRATLEFEDGLVADVALTGRALRPAFVEVWQQEGSARALDVLHRADVDAADIEMRWSPDNEPHAVLGAADRQNLAAHRDVVEMRPEASPGRLFVFVPTAAGGAIELSQAVPARRVVLLRMIRDRLFASLAAVAGAAALTTVAAVWVVGRPMARLVEHARRIGAGDLSHQEGAARRDEIGELAGEMNKMCDRLLEARVGMAAAADARVRALEQVRRADRLSTVGTLASGMAHELGTPLSIISGRAKMISSASEPASEPAQFARIIVAQAEKMTRIMRGLLDFARRRPAEKVPVDLREVVERTLDLLGPLAKKRDVSLRLEADGPAVAEVDAAQVEQAITNLVVNGVHAMSAGGEIVVSTHAFSGKPPHEPDAPEASWLRVAVEDGGDGIRAEDLHHVFEPFYTTKDVGEGTGLGLSVTYGIVRDHGGFIDVVSQPGKGSCFSLYFPTKEAA
jgi:two-component system NtrC family sensor kinase